MAPDISDLLPRLGLALALGLLVGLQREHAHPGPAGIRTFPLITLLGALTAVLAAPFGPWLPAAALVSLAALLVAVRLRQPADVPHLGLTTEVAALLMFAVGAWAGTGAVAGPVALGGAVMVLLQLKPQMQAFVHHIGETDLRAIAQFVLISLVVLPALPDRGYGPWGVLNPREIWLMVVLIVGISLGGYVLAKMFGARAGTLLGGVLGGVISSTATTVSYARRTREAAAAGEDASRPATVVVMIASTIAFLRFAVLVAAVAPGLFAVAAPPLLALGGVLALITGALLLGARGGALALPVHSNPAELKPALVFGGLYAVVIVLVAAANHHLGQGALYLVSVVSGTTDMDAITLSVARLCEKGEMAPAVAWRLVMAAALANLVFKGGIAAVLGTRALASRVAVAFVLALAAGVAILCFWPG